jgi:hypothetical protein
VGGGDRRAGQDGDPRLLGGPGPVAEPGRDPAAPSRTVPAAGTASSAISFERIDRFPNIAAC